MDGWMDGDGVDFGISKPYYVSVSEVYNILRHILIFVQEKLVKKLKNCLFNGI